MELEYEGEQLGANRIARDLIKRAAGEVFEGYFVGIDFSPTVQWFDEGNKLLLADTASAEECRRLLESVPELLDTAQIPFDFKQLETAKLVAACELVLEGLYAQNKISRNEEGGYSAITKARKDRRGMIYDDLTETGKYS
jgi:magnesium chelatase subunit I